MRDRILDRALELFNERGVEYVGTRELARELGMKAGHITYYFPTRDDLVAALADRLRQRNDATIRLPEHPSPSAYMAMLRQALQNQHEFRCLMMSLPNLLAHNPKLAAGYVGATEKERRRVIRTYLGELRAAGYLRADVEDDELDRTVSLIALVARAWVGDASISFRDQSPEWCMDHYLSIIADHLAGLSTEVGLADLGRRAGTEGTGVTPRE